MPVWWGEGILKQKKMIYKEDIYMKKIILASASPRRRELLANVGVIFQVCPGNSEERVTKEIPEEIVEELSLQKAMAVVTFG